MDFDDLWISRDEALELMREYEAKYDGDFEVNDEYLYQAATYLKLYEKTQETDKKEEQQKKANPFKIF